MILQEQRNRSTFNKTQLSYLIYGSKQNFQSFLVRQNAIISDPLLRNEPSYLHKSRKFVMDLFAKKFIRHLQLFKYTMDNTIELGLFWTIQFPLSLHFLMFLTTLRNLCDPQQVERFLRPAEEGRILGCYAQTQLGHGSDVQNLMTEAVYDAATEEFVVHTPCIKAAKWWVGDLGVYCTHACLFAQLIVKGKKHGVHAFLVPIRDENHQLYKGVQAGDIGPKMGFNNKDNGYVIFDHYRIPRKNMLMKFHHLSKDGEYEMRGDQKVSYATMLVIRGLIPKIGFNHLSKAVTILTRYSLVRKQFKDKNGLQIPLLNYQIQQQKVITRISQSYITLFAFKSLSNLSKFVVEQAKENRFEQLNEAHVITSAIKSILTYDILKGLEILRRAAGGHGFLMYSGVPAQLLQYTSSYTLQGQFTVLQLQVARFILKCMTKLQKNKPLPPSAMYLEECNRPSKYVCDCKDYSQLLNIETLRQIFLQHSCEQTKLAISKISEAVAQGISFKQAWNQVANITLVDTGIAYSYLWLVQNAHESIYKLTKNESVRAVLLKLLVLYALDKLIQRGQYYFATGTVTSGTLKCAQECKEEILAQLRPEALSLVEAFAYDDNILMSAIGGRQGKPYETLLDWSKNYNQVNKPEIKAELIQKIIQTKQKIRGPKL